jgi:hypothetical protein
MASISSGSSLFETKCVGTSLNRRIVQAGESAVNQQPALSNQQPDRLGGDLDYVRIAITPIFMVPRG